MKRRILLVVIFICVTLIYSCADKTDRDSDRPDITFGPIKNGQTLSPLELLDKTDQPIDITSGNIKPGDNVFEFSSVSIFFDDDAEFYGYSFTEDRLDWASQIESKFGIKLKVTNLYNQHIDNTLFNIHDTNLVYSNIKRHIDNESIKGLFKVGSHGAVNRLAKDGLIMPLDSYLQDNEVWQTLPDDYKNAFVIDGLTYGIPTGSSNRKYTRFIRKDWLDKFNMEIPDSITGFYEVMKVFKNNDPDGNGISDTYGLDYFQMSGLEDIFASFDVRLNPDRKLIPTWNPGTGIWEDSMLKPEMGECLDFLRACYKEGLILNSKFYGGIPFYEGASGSKYLSFVPYSYLYENMSEEMPENQEPVLGHIPAFRHLVDDKINGYYSIYHYPMVLSKNNTYPDTSLNTFLDVFIGNREGFILGRYGPEGSGYFMNGDTVIVTTFENDGEISYYLWYGPILVQKSPLVDVEATSDYAYESGYYSGESADEIAWRAMREEYEKNPLCYEVPWEVVFPKYSVETQFKLEELHEVTESLVDHCISGDLTYEYILGEYRSWAKKSGLQGFLDEQNYKLGVKSQQSYK